MKKRIFITFSLLFLYHLCHFIPLPGLDPQKLSFLNHFFIYNDSFSILHFINIFDQDTSSVFSIIALGIMPFISACIIMQLILACSRKLKHKQTTNSSLFEREFNNWTYWLMGFLAIIQSFIISIGITKQGYTTMSGMLFIPLTTISLTGATCLAVWIGKMINKHGIGHGYALMIMLTILGSVQTIIRQINTLTPEKTLMFVILLVGLGALIIYFLKKTFNLPLDNISNDSQQHFSLSVPCLLSGIIVLNMSSTAVNVILQSLMIAMPTVFESPHIYPVLYYLFLSVFLFVLCFFWTAIVFSPKQLLSSLKQHCFKLADNISEKNTIKILSKQMLKYTVFPSAIFLLCITSFSSLCYYLFDLEPPINGINLLIVIGTVYFLFISFQKQRQYSSIYRSGNLTELLILQTKIKQEGIDAIIQTNECYGNLLGLHAATPLSNKSLAVPHQDVERSSTIIKA